MVKEAGPDEAVAEIARQLERTDRQSLPVVRAIARLRTLQTVGLHVDAGATVIAKSRSRAFHAARHSGAAVWFSIDDDVEADTTALRTMYDAVKGRAAVCVAPCWVRDQNRVQVALKSGRNVAPLQQNTPEEKTRPCYYGGFGLVAVSREALDRIAGENSHLAYDDDDGVARLAIFHEELIGRGWFNEDLTFFLRLPADVDVVCLAHGVTVHQGRPLICANLDQLPTWQLNQNWPLVAPSSGPLLPPLRTAEHVKSEADQSERSEVQS
jgi:hypothetical protein